MRASTVLQKRSPDSQIFASLDTPQCSRKPLGRAHPQSGAERTLRGGRRAAWSRRFVPGHAGSGNSLGFCVRAEFSTDTWHYFRGSRHWCSRKARCFQICFRFRWIRAKITRAPKGLGLLSRLRVVDAVVKRVLYDCKLVKLHFSHIVWAEDCHQPMVDYLVTCAVIGLQCRLVSRGCEYLGHR